jgi:hypothetical protein
MKIYIVNILPEALKNKLDNFCSFLLHKREKYELFSEEYGLHIVEHDNNSNSNSNNSNNKETQIYKIESTFDTSYHMLKDYTSSFGATTNSKNSTVVVDLLFDLTDYVKIDVISQLPTKYVLTKMTKFVYKFNKKSKWEFVIECIRETNTELLEKEWIPINFYFSYKYSANEPKITDLQNLDDLLFQEEINVFLTHLN